MRALETTPPPELIEEIKNKTEAETKNKTAIT